MLDVKKISGLSEDEAQQRLVSEGLNELPSARRSGVFAIALEVVREPMFLLLMACGGIYLATGHVQDALILLSFVVFIMGITIVQERRTEHALDALRDLSSPRALVIRDGQERRIAGKAVVRGDIMLLAEGDRVPADAFLIQAIGMSVDESLLTGESVPVRKDETQLIPNPLPRPGGDGLPMVYSGTMVTKGQGVAEVVATGARTEIGKIGKALASLTQEETFLQRETGRLVRILAVVGLSLCGVVVVAYAFSRGGGMVSWRDGLLAGLTMAMAVVPEEFPVVLTVFLALGAWRISRVKVLTRRMPAVEMLGAATVLCVDKTGTLTRNQMTLRKIWAKNGGNFEIPKEPSGNLPEDFHALLEYGILASNKDPFDPMEKALREVGKAYLLKTEHWHDNWELMREYPLTSSLLAMSHVWVRAKGDACDAVAAKGAPEAIADLCHMSAEEYAPIGEVVAEMAKSGLRVLGVARGLCNGGELPQEQHGMLFQFLGLVGLEDPVRDGVPEAIAECRNAGISVVMITGDHPETARHVAKVIGLPEKGVILTGPELDALDDETLAARISEVSVFARVVPEQKLRIVEALKKQGQVVAMTGDGVNDAPALKSAHIGIAMGARGTDVAREAADIVLLDDAFSSIVAAVRLGRRIYDNIREAMNYLFAIHIPIIFLSMLPTFSADFPILLLPIHVAFLEMIIDPACSIIFEAEQEEPGIMHRKPRAPKARLFTLEAMAPGLLQGVSLGIMLVAIFLVALNAGHDAPALRALTFSALIIGNVLLILSNRSKIRTMWDMLRVPNPAVWWVVGGAAVFLGVALLVPSMRVFFHFSAPHPMDMFLALAGGVFAVLWLEFLKVYRYGKEV
ncbi:MAG TPA: ATPase [Rhodospirillaceae bacterium]|nr:MAG: ATPase [Alphaproteobacteria bacterium GWF2_58_20]HAU28817.1 ATPase [Rhodospirillaceae bacterium]